MEVSLLRWRLQGGEGFWLTKCQLHESQKAFYTRETHSLQAA